MAVKYAKEIVEEIKSRGTISVQPNCVTGEAFEAWLKTLSYKHQTHNQEESNTTK